MIKKIFLLTVIALIILSCRNTGKKEVTSGNEGSTNTIKVEFASLISDPAAYVGKNISIEGKVVHVCTMSGKKLFITGENPDVRLYVQAGEEMPKFPMELLGSEIVIEGTIKNVAASGMAGEGCMQSGEGLALREGAVKAPGADSCETEKALASQPVLADLMMVYNKHSVVK